LVTYEPGSFAVIVAGHHTQTTNCGYSRKPDGGFFTSWGSHEEVADVCFIETYAVFATSQRNNVCTVLKSTAVKTSS